MRFFKAYVRLLYAVLWCAALAPAYAAENPDDPIVLGPGEYYVISKDDPDHPKPAPDDSSQPVDLQADNLSHDDQNKILTASGHVRLAQAGRILRADRIDYDLTQDVAHAVGHVVLYDKDGTIHTADEVQLNDQLKTGFVKKLKSVMTDGSRFTADEGVRKDAVTTTMTNATYSPCVPCKEHPEKAPLWQISADKMIHDETNHRIMYDDATFDVYGYPVMYTPYFAHSDGTIKRKSGFLSPSFGYKSTLGAMLGSEYYWAMGDDHDATMGVTAMTAEAPLLTGQYRQRWDNASLKMDGSVTRSGRTGETDDGESTEKPDEVRGHFFANGLWDINDEWRAGTNLKITSDDQYLRQYSIDGEDVLTNEVYAERLAGRNYAVGRLLTFQDVRLKEDREDQPDVLPEIISSFEGEPGSVPVVGGRWSFDGSFLGLQRPGVNQDMNRISTDAGWQRRLVSNTGLLTTIDANARTDIYNTQDRDEAYSGSGRSSQSTDVRFFPQVNAQMSYPLQKNMAHMQATIEPIVSITAAPNIDAVSSIPNEDSRDVQIDASNIFDPNRFPGVDRIEDQSHVTYGVRTGLYGEKGSYGDIFLGQSHRLQEDDNPFPDGSGLNEQTSDIVGQISALYADNFSLDYRFQLGSKDLSSQRHEVDMHATFGHFEVGSNYLFAKALEGTDIDESREQINNSLTYYITDDWAIDAAATHDLGAEPGLRQASLGLDYYGQCLSWSLIGVENKTDDATGQSSEEVLFRIGLKNVGEYMQSGLKARRQAEYDKYYADMNDMQ